MFKYEYIVVVVIICKVVDFNLFKRRGVVSGNLMWFSICIFVML